MRITRRIEFDAGHRVYGHESKCAHLHGHRYVAEVTVEAELLDDVGRVVDFSVIKTRVGEWIDRHWDHNLLLNPIDPFRLIFAEHLSVNGNKVPYPMQDGNPTAENMAKELYYVATHLLAPLKVVHVRIYETPNCWADYHEQ